MVVTRVRSGVAGEGEAEGVREAEGGECSSSGSTKAKARAGPCSVRSHQGCEATGAVSAGALSSFVSFSSISGRFFSTTVENIRTNSKINLA